MLVWSFSILDSLLVDILNIVRGHGGSSGGGSGRGGSGRGGRLRGGRLRRGRGPVGRGQAGQGQAIKKSKHYNKLLKILFQPSSSTI